MLITNPTCALVFTNALLIHKESIMYADNSTTM